MGRVGRLDLLQAWLRERSPLVVADRIRCPVLVVDGWHDTGMPPNEVVTMFTRLQVPKKLYLGGGGHDGQDDDDARQSRETLVDRWLDHWLQGRDPVLLSEPSITCVPRPGWQEVGVDAIPETGATGLTLFLPSFQVHAELYAVDAAGGATLISRGHWGTRAAGPGRHLQIDVELANILYRVAAGHRLRLVVANCNTTYAVPMFHHACTRLFHDDARPSSVALPLSATPG